MNQYSPAVQPPASPMVFTLEDDNQNAPVYEAAAQEWETAPHDWKEPEEAAPETAADVPEVLPPSDDVLDAAKETETLSDDKPQNDADKDFRLPETAPDNENPAPNPEPRMPDADKPDAGISAAAALGRTDDDAPSAAETVLPETPAQPAREYSAEETDYARRRYLAYLGAEHNRSVPDTDLDGNPLAQADAAVLIQEDWLAAQQALHAGQKDDFQLPVSTLKLNGLDGAAPDTPEITVNVYDAVELPVGRKVKILSEQALLEAVRERLRPHLTNVVAGLAARVLQKKTALLSYELQMTLNDEVPQAVEEVLAHHLDEIMRALKEEA